MALKDVEFTDEDIEQVVEPVMEIADAFASALIVTLHASMGGGDVREAKKAWRVLADKVLRFAKEVE